VDQPSLIIWLGPTLAAMFAWGIAQGLVKKYVGEVPPARFCLYYGLANATVSMVYCAINYAFYGPIPDVLAESNRAFLFFGLSAYILDGIAWIFYYQSIVHGPISIVGTLSAAYPALTIVLARAFLSEKLENHQYLGVTLVLLGCCALGYSPPDPDQKKTNRIWMLYAAAALIIWGANGVLIKHAYTLEGAHEGNMMIFIAVGGLLTLGTYGFVFGRKGAFDGAARSAGPMGMMALGSLLANLAYKYGPASIVTPLSGAYPVITLTFAMMILKERPTRLHWGGIGFILVGALLAAITLGSPAEQSADGAPTVDAGSAVVPKPPDQPPTSTDPHPTPPPPTP
jgi:drug/metabolite transporter (DMT)-like permease